MGFSNWGTQPIDIVRRQIRKSARAQRCLAIEDDREPKQAEDLRIHDAGSDQDIEYDIDAGSCGSASYRSESECSDDEMTPVQMPRPPKRAREPNSQVSVSRSTRISPPISTEESAHRRKRRRARPHAQAAGTSRTTADNDRRLASIANAYAYM